MKIKFITNSNSVGMNTLSTANTKITKKSGIANTEEWKKYRNEGKSLMDMLANALKSR